MAIVYFVCNFSPAPPLALTFVTMNDTKGDRQVGNAILQIFHRPQESNCRAQAKGYTNIVQAKRFLFLIVLEYFWIAVQSFGANCFGHEKGLTKNTKRNYRITTKMIKE